MKTFIVSVTAFLVGWGVMWLGYAGLDYNKVAYSPTIHAVGISLDDGRDMLASVFSGVFDLIGAKSIEYKAHNN